MVTFAVSRMRRVEKTGDYFEIADSFDPKEHIRQSFGIVRGDKLFKVRLLFAKKIATYIKERQWHPTQKIREKAMLGEVRGLSRIDATLGILFAHPLQADVGMA